MNYGYIRVSSDKQTVENQRFEITQYCEHNHIQYVKIQKFYPIAT